MWIMSKTRETTQNKVYMTATKEEHRGEKLTVASSTLSRQIGCSDLEISLDELPSIRYVMCGSLPRPIANPSQFSFLNPSSSDHLHHSRPNDYHLPLVYTNVLLILVYLWLNDQVPCSQWVLPPKIFIIKWS